MANTHQVSQTGVTVVNELADASKVVQVAQAGVTALNLPADAAKLVQVAQAGVTVVGLVSGNVMVFGVAFE